jgi:hypothetical protein
MARIRASIVLGLAAAAALVPVPASAQPSEAAVKAAFLTKFAGYVDWPAGQRLAPGDPLQICIVGADPFGKMIDEAVRGQQVDGHPLALRRLGGPDGAEGCRLVFIAGNSARATADLLAAFRGRPVLTVTDGRAGPQRGMIHFVIADGRVRFDIDQVEAVHSGLNLNARLLGVALSVKAAH